MNGNPHEQGRILEAFQRFSEVTCIPHHGQQQFQNYEWLLFACLHFKFKKVTRFL